jgi:hypothetical protein
MQGMSMYVDVLSSALDGWADEPSGSALVDYALTRRAEMAAHGRHSEHSAYAVLAAEVSYDRALVSLCTGRGIEVIRCGFAHRQEERGRLERELARAGIDLAALARQRGAPQA